MRRMTPLHEYFLIACADDWSGPWMLVTDVRLSEPNVDDKTVQTRTLTILRDLLEAGYIQAGDLVNFKNDTFVPWDLPVDKIIERIRLEWDGLGRDPKPWEIVWFTSTIAGERALAEGKERNELKDSEEQS